MAAISKKREQRRHWQQVRELIHQEADVDAVSWQLRLAILKDAKLVLSALSEPTRQPERPLRGTTPLLRPDTGPSAHIRAGSAATPLRPQQLGSGCKRP
jgi:hypothetical protein